MLDIEREYELVAFKTRLLYAEIALHGMIASNKQREIQGNSMCYSEGDFISLIKEYNIGENDIPCYRG